MSFTEDGKYFPDDVLVEAAKEKSGLLRAFFSPHDDFVTWEKRLREEGESTREQFDQTLSEGWRIASPVFFYNGILQDIFAPEFLAQSQRREQVRMVGIGIMFIGYHAKEQQLLSVLAPKMRDKVTQLPFIKPYLLDQESVGKYVRLPLAIGAEVYTHYPDMTSLQTERTQIDWDPGIFGEFIESLDLDGFTGERPE